MERGRGQSAPPPVQATAGVYFFLMFWLFTGIYATVISIFYILYYMYIYVLRVFSIFGRAAAGCGWGLNMLIMRLSPVQNTT